MTGFSFFAKIKSVIPPDSLECFAPTVWRYWVGFHLNAEVCHWSPKLAWLEPPAGVKYQLLSHTSRKQKTKYFEYCSTWKTLQISNKGQTGGKIHELHTSWVANGPSEPDPLHRGWNFSGGWDRGGDKSGKRAVFRNPSEQWTCTLNLTFGVQQQWMILIFFNMVPGEYHLLEGIKWKVPLLWKKCRALHKGGACS